MPATGEKLFPVSFPDSDTMWCPSKIDPGAISVPIVLSGASHLLRQPIFIAHPLIGGMLIPDSNKYFITSRRKWTLEKSHLLFLFCSQNHNTFKRFSLKHCHMYLYPSFQGNHYCTLCLCIWHIQGGSEVFLPRQWKKSSSSSHVKSSQETLPLMALAFWKTSWPFEYPGPLCTSWLCKSCRVSQTA